MRATHTWLGRPSEASPLVRASTSPRESAMPRMTATDSHTRSAKTTSSHTPFSAIAGAAGRRLARAQAERLVAGSHCHTTYPASPT